MSALALGTQVQLVFRTQFPTFTAEQFSRALREREYLEAKGEILNPQNPQAPPIPIQTFSKGELTVALLPTDPPTVTFQILNTINLEPKYAEIKAMLRALNILDYIIGDARFSCTTRREAKTKPIDRLTSMVDEAFLDRIRGNFSADMKVASIRFATSFPLQQRETNWQMVIEPLASNPDNEYFLSINYRTNKMNEFDRFISEFGLDMIERIIEEAKEETKEDV